MTDRPGPWDPGLQPERTALAWRRTALALTLGSLVAARLLLPAGGPVAVVTATLGLLAGLGVATVSAARARAVERLLDCAVPRRGLPGGAVLAATAAGVAIGGALLVALALHDGIGTTPVGLTPPAHQS